ncbi:SDR family NAD(P)-dependent oxidoreductase [Streptomyces sp. NBC_00320]|uniref:SDR family NAD(P)-dependent oxidoreductase n=1 Tax=unclassified Streptomyces TaxID=2593676 RepID=UPI00225B3CEC|nr:SDR family NAD(P)-dependent oxidoreductase [Streptomyces sp. NBC_00320]MCX5149405.1 SDR family NAD(P)-dependent oxidoreductase [Streptomyces sp. NBC_00320]
MTLERHRVVITAAGRDFGRTLALRFAARGAEVHLSARTLEAAERVREEILAQGHDADRVHAFACDLTDPASVREFAAAVAARTDRIDVLVNNGSRYQHGTDLLSASDADVVDTLASGATGTVLAKDPLTAQSLVDCIFFALGQPRDCFIKSFRFEQV